MFSAISPFSKYSAKIIRLVYQMKVFLLLLLLILSGCGNERLISIDFYQHEDTIRIPVVAHVRSMYDVKMTVPLLIRHANKALSPHGFTIDTIFYVVDKSMPVVETTRDLKRLMRYADRAPEAIHLFVTMSVLDNNGNPAHGVYLVSPTNDCRDIIIISDTAQESTFTHELGHKFGLEHQEDKSNLMRSGTRWNTADFDEEQIETILANARDFITRC